MSVFSSAHTLIHPLLSPLHLYLLSQVNVISHLTQCSALITSFPESILTVFQSFSTYKSDILKLQFSSFHCLHFSKFYLSDIYQSKLGLAKYNHKYNSI